MKSLGLVMLIAGYGWIGFHLFDFTSEQHAMWVAQTGKLSNGKSVTRDEASGAMREISLALNTRHKRLAIPATIMFAGGLMAAFSRPQKKRDDWQRF
jgi:hypothetical protein